MAHIGMILLKNFPPDIRVTKEAKTLLGAGYKVSVLAKKSARYSAELENINGLQVCRVQTQVGSIASLKQAVSYARAFFNDLVPIIQRFIERQRPDVLHVHDFIFYPTVLRVAALYGLPVVVDLHENIPAAFREYRRWQPWYRRVGSAIVKNYHLWKYFEKKYLPRSTAIIVVVQEAKQRLIQEYGIREDKIWIVGNTESQELWGPEGTENSNEVVQQYSDTWVLLYVGGIAPHRGIDTVLRSIPQIRRSIPRFKFLVVGSGPPEFRQYLETLTLQLGVEKQVEFVGRVLQKEVINYIKLAKLCIVPHRRSEHTDTTVPHKLFQYMIAGKPVLVSNCAPLERIVRESGGGRVFTSENSYDLARQVVALFEQGDEYLQSLGKQGYQYATQINTLHYDAQRLLEVYRFVVQ